RLGALALRVGRGGGRGRGCPSPVPVPPRPDPRRRLHGRARSSRAPTLPVDQRRGRGHGAGDRPRPSAARGQLNHAIMQELDGSFSRPRAWVNLGLVSEAKPKPDHASPGAGIEPVALAAAPFLTRGVELDGLLVAIVDTIVDRLAAERGTLYLVDGRTRTL